MRQTLVVRSPDLEKHLVIDAQQLKDMPETQVSATGHVLDARDLTA